MKRATLTALAFSFVLGSFLLLARRPAVSGVVVARPEQILPTMLVSEVVACFGKVRANFEVVNSSNSPREFVFEGAKCGCSSVLVDGRVVARGDRVRLEGGQSAKVEMQTNVPHQAGQRDYYATLSTSDRGVVRTIDLKSSMKVLDDVRVTPEVFSVAFPPSASQAVERTLVVEHAFRAGGVSEGPVPVLAGSPPYLKVVRVARQGLPAESESGLWRQSWRVTVSVLPTDDLTSTASPNRVIVSFPGEGGAAPSEAFLPVLVSRVGGVEAPKSIHFGEAPLGQSRVKSIMLRSGDEKPFEIVGATSASSAFSASIKSEGARVAHRVELAFLASRVGTEESELHIITNCPDAREIKIDLRGIGTRPGSDSEGR